MREINFDTLTVEKLHDHAQLIEAFKEYLKCKLLYSDSEASFVAGDLDNPYNTPFIMQDYEGDYEIDGKEYEVRFCYTDYGACGLCHLANVEPFEFYMLFDKATLPDTTVAAYQKAEKKYII